MLTMQKLRVLKACRSANVFSELTHTPRFIPRSSSNWEAKGLQRSFFLAASYCKTVLPMQHKQEDLTFNEIASSSKSLVLTLACVAGLTISGIHLLCWEVGIKQHSSTGSMQMLQLLWAHKKLKQRMETM